MDLNTILKSSYLNKEKQKHALSRYGYKYNSMLSDHDQQVYYNPNDRKLLNVVSGSHNLKDFVVTDVALALGHLKDTNRYKQAAQILKQAKHKYSPRETTVVGHSLGGSISSYIASKNDKEYDVNSGYTIGQKSRSRDGNHKHYRTTGDIVSLLGSNNPHVQTIDSGNSIKKNILASTAIASINPVLGAVNFVNNVVKSHKTEPSKETISPVVL